jgi:hypothetical protein
MNTDRSLFLQDEVLKAFFDDFMVLPIAYQIANVVVGASAAVERHDLAFAFTH